MANVDAAYDVLLNLTGLGDSTHFKALKRRLDVDGLDGHPDAYVFYHINAAVC